MSEEYSPPKKAYNRVARWNHWITAIAIMPLLIIGWVLFFDLLPQSDAGPLRDLHKAFGTLVLLFALWRVGYRLVDGFPDHVPGVSTAQAQLARVVHYLLLACIIIMPTSGFLKSIYAGRGVDMFGLFTIGTSDTKNEMISGVASTFHYAGGIVLSLLIVVHVIAAIKHHFVDRDTTLKRMLQG